jgi:N-acetylglutamate synthase/N-acetylornithine aminotransferase
VDGDTSTDTVFLLAWASHAVLSGRHSCRSPLADVVEAVARDLACQQAADGEGDRLPAAR